MGFETTKNGDFIGHTEFGDVTVMPDGSLGWKDLHENDDPNVNPRKNPKGLDGKLTFPFPDRWDGDF